eukprot:14642552-Alexandrium_andersonii.AAC.1
MLHGCVHERLRNAACCKGLLGAGHMAARWSRHVCCRFFWLHTGACRCKLAIHGCAAAAHSLLVMVFWRGTAARCALLSLCAH